MRSTSRKVFNRPRWYPERIHAGDFGAEFDCETIEFLNSSKCSLQSADKSSLVVAEFGIWKGATSLKFAEFLENRGTLHLFDYEDNVRSVSTALEHAGYENVIAWGSTYKYLDSYNWHLMRMIEHSPTAVFDYVYLDGAHTWAIDALTFFLCDLLLKPGGYIDFDDYHWKLRGSGLDPRIVPETSKLYTAEQIDTPQVKMIVDLLVKRNSNYRVITENKIYQKVQRPPAPDVAKG